MVFFKYRMHIHINRTEERCQQKTDFERYEKTL